MSYKSKTLRFKICDTVIMPGFRLASWREPYWYTYDKNGCKIISPLAICIVTEGKVDKILQLFVGPLLLYVAWTSLD